MSDSNGEGSSSRRNYKILSSEGITSISLIENGFSNGVININYNGREGEVRYEVEGNPTNSVTVSKSMDGTELVFAVNSQASNLNATVNISLSPGLALDEFKGQITSGTLKVTGPAKFKSFTAKATSGDIKVSSISCQDLKLEMVSGNIVAKTITSEKVKTQITSGNANLDMDGPFVILHCTSGNLTAKVSGYKNVVAQTTSGNTKLELTPNSTATDKGKGKSTFTSIDDVPSVKLTCTSGNVKATVAGYKTLQTQTTSGSTKLDLTPRYGSKTRLQTTTGSVKATFNGFNGSFKGFTRVNGPGVVLQDRSRKRRRDDDEGGENMQHENSNMGVGVEDTTKSGTVGQGDMEATCTITNGDCIAIFN